MCEFCMQHGEGRKWYLQARNYSEDMLSDVRRRNYIQKFVTDTEGLARDVEALERLAKAPRIIRGLISRIISQRMKKIHFGQVVPIEDIEKIFGFVNSIVRMACLCRHVSLGKEKRYCYGLGLSAGGGQMAEIIRGMDQSFINTPGTAGLESLSHDEALAALHAHEREGLCHTVWTFHAPFIGAICNCDRADCIAMRMTVTHAVPIMFRGEYVARVLPDECVGCRECMRVCQFGAMTYGAANQAAVVDPRWCYGCGVCRTACKKDAIRLEDRRSIAKAANLW